MLRLRYSIICLLVATTAVVAGCGGAAHHFTTAPERSAYSQCKAWADQGQTQSTVGSEIGTYIAGNDFTTEENDAITKACAAGFVDGGG